MESPSLRVSCLCGNISQLIAVKPPLDNVDPTSRDLSLCHCNSCRHSSGLLCVSYRPIAAPAPLPRGLSEYNAAADGWTRYFCSNCGCHVLRRKGEDQWELATGVVIESIPDHDENPRFVNHVHVTDTKDGGSAVWIPECNGQAMDMPGSEAEPTTSSSVSSNKQKKDEDEEGEEGEEEHLPASCDCGRVSFHITRPNLASYNPRSNVADLILPYSTTDPAITQNPADDKWWIRAAGTKYLGGTCACRSCRLISGFEIQTWAFVPRTNIVFNMKYGRDDVPLDFGALPPNVLTSYRSSPGVLREFCGTCGATVFWHDKWRPDLIDVSVGLLRAREGARAESWIDWWTERVSFTEEAENGRTGVEAKTARALISSLEKGLLRWSKRE
ncbi:glutathione-dependent formaldehyde-activating enzyme [Thelonectria olida]|uniref:Glutathione-dependent formaldehyde-activating enzyme n=1 Tax=Thelonectria olida TaxID=1576542 RepID=A0A9P9AQW9_9HYPO|nr:glutathione-dependent formaldehyde-activating enzyme [Thelonectria olida]